MLICAVSILFTPIQEAMEHGDIEQLAAPLGHNYIYELSAEEKADNTLIVKNGLSGTDKLKYALEVAESVALLHSFSGGVIVHDDLKPGQILMTADGHAKLNDFNRAEIMLWDEEGQDYCRYRNGEGNGRVRIICLFGCTNCVDHE